MTVDTIPNIDATDLDRLNIFELRNLAFELGVDEPMTKTHEQIITEVRRVIENEELYTQVSFE